MDRLLQLQHKLRRSEDWLDELIESLTAEINAIARTQRKKLRGNAPTSARNARP